MRPIWESASWILPRNAFTFLFNHILARTCETGTDIVYDSSFGEGWPFGDTFMYYAICKLHSDANWQMVYTNITIHRHILAELVSWKSLANCLVKIISSKLICQLFVQLICFPKRYPLQSLSKLMFKLSPFDFWKAKVRHLKNVSLPLDNKNGIWWMQFNLKLLINSPQWNRDRENTARG